jgi:hypothetical protein
MGLRRDAVQCAARTRKDQSGERDGLSELLCHPSVGAKREAAIGHRFTESAISDNARGGIVGDDQVLAKMGRL